MAIRLSPPPLEQSVRAHGTEERSIARSRNLVDDSFLQRRGDRKRIVAPDGSAIVPTTKPHPDRTLVKALARASQWQKLVDGGRHATVREIAEAEGIGSRMSVGSCGWRCWRRTLSALSSQG
jgi:hypothetical protein